MSQTAVTTNEILLQIENLETHFITDAGTVRAVDNVACRFGRARPWGSWGSRAAARASRLFLCYG